MAQLKGGFITTDPRLDRLPAFDEQSRQYPIGAVTVGATSVIQKQPRSYTHRIDYWLDQGREGRCVEYSICHDLLAKPVKVDPRFTTDILAGKKIYWPSQRDDYWPGGSYPGAQPFYEGTSVLHGVKTAATLGFYTEYRWAFTLEEAILALGYVGPLILGINWHRGMFNAAADGFIRPTGPVEGGHAILAHKVSVAWKPGTKWVERTWDDVDLDRSFITLHNSWGPGWGVNGRAKLTLRDFDMLRRARGEVCIIPPKGRAHSAVFPVPDLMKAA